jgi:membrane protein DedA with SNARE-associated domain
MEAFLDFVQANVTLAPYAFLGLLILAGFNIPISEDLMLLSSALIAIKNPHLKYELFAGVFLGAYISDLICYGFMGRFLGPKIFQIKFFANMISQEKLDKINSFYAKYGVATLIIGRFIPFGVRNALFLTAGLGKMNAVKFALCDFIACTISCVFFFWLYFTYGESVIDLVKKGNMILFALFAAALTGWFIHKKVQAKKELSSPTETKN